MSPADFYHHLRCFFERFAARVWPAKPVPADDPYVHLTIDQFEALLDMTPPDDLVVVEEKWADAYAFKVPGGYHQCWFLTDDPDSEQSIREHDRFIDARNCRAFWQALIRSQEGE